MKNLLLIMCLGTFSTFGYSQELILGDVYSPEAIEKLFNDSFLELKDQKCLNKYLSTPDYRARIRQGSKVRSVNVCSEGRSIRFNIRFDQMGGVSSSLRSINTIVNCTLVKPMAAQSCYEY